MNDHKTLLIILEQESWKKLAGISRNAGLLPEEEVRLLIAFGLSDQSPLSEKRDIIAETKTVPQNTFPVFKGLLKVLGARLKAKVGSRISSSGGQNSRGANDYLANLEISIPAYHYERLRNIAFVHGESVSGEAARIIEKQLEGYCH